MKTFFIFFLFLSSVQAAPSNWKSVSDQGHLEFMAVGHPAMIRIKGESTAPDGDLKIENQKAQGRFVLSLDKLTTGIEMRDHHMKEKYLEVPSHPQAIFTFQNLSLTADKAQDIPFEGELDLHGVKKTVHGIYSFEPAGNQKKSHAEFKIKLSDFGIQIPSYAGITVADEVQIKMDLALKQE